MIRKHRRRSIARIQILEGISKTIVSLNAHCAAKDGHVIWQVVGEDPILKHTPRQIGLSSANIKTQLPPLRSYLSSWVCLIVVLASTDGD